jgi:hypothetical protein
MNDNDLGYVNIEERQAQVREYQQWLAQQPEESGFIVLPKRQPPTAAQRVRRQYDSARTQVQEATR